MKRLLLFLLVALALPAPAQRLTVNSSYRVVTVDYSKAYGQIYGD